MVATTSLALISKNRRQVVVFEEEVCNAGVATAHKEAEVLDEPGRLHVAGNVGSLHLEELNVIIQLERHDIAHDAVEDVEESGVALEHGR